MMLADATLQVPFMADLVTLADPTSRFSYLAFLKDVGRLYPFYIRESFYPLRREYDDYCRWAAERLDSVRWGERVVAVEHDGEAYVVRSATGAPGVPATLVLGTGTAPRLPFDVDGPGAPLRRLPRPQGRAARRRLGHRRRQRPERGRGLRRPARRAGGRTASS